MVVGEVFDRADAVMVRCEFQQVLAGVVLAGGRHRQDALRDDPFGEVVHAGEVGRPAHRGEGPGIQQMFERDLAVVPVPPRPLRTHSLLEVAGDEWALVAHPRQYVVDEMRLVAPDPGNRLPTMVLRHVPPQVRVELDGHMAGLVDVELEQIMGSGGVGDQRTRMRSEPGEQRQLLAADEHVDRVDLDEPHPVDDAAEMPAVDAARRPRHR